MPVVDDQRIVRVGVRIEAFGQKHVRAEIHRAAPEIRQELALDAYVLDVLRILRRLDRRNHLVESQLNGLAAAGIDFDLLRLAVEVAGRAAPLLAFAPIHGQFDRVSVFASEGLVAMQERLHPILARGNL